MTDDPRPNLFLIGAPKCGTTAMQTYLGQHRDVFVPETKPPRFFARDFSFRKRVSAGTYTSHFAAGHAARYRADCSVWNLASLSACHEIARWNPSARAIIMLRDPVAVLFALHNEFLWEGVEDCDSLADALEKEPARKRGEELPTTAGDRNVPFFPEMLQYRDAVKFAGQVERAWDAFGKDRLLVIIHDDLKADTSEVFDRVCEFLELPPQPGVDFSVVNRRKKTRFSLLQRAILNPPSFMPIVLDRVLGRRNKDRIYRTLRRWNTRPATRDERRADPLLERQLRDEFRPEIERLGQLIGRDLSSWTAGASSSNQ